MPEKRVSESSQQSFADLVAGLAKIDFDSASPLTAEADLELEIHSQLNVRGESCQVTDPSLVVAKLVAESADGSSQTAEISMGDLVPDGNCLGLHTASRQLSVPVTELGSHLSTVSGIAGNLVLDSGDGLTMELGFRLSYGSYSYATEYLAPEVGGRKVLDEISILLGPAS